MGVFDKFNERDINDAEGFSRTPNMNEPGTYGVTVVRHTLGTSQANKSQIKFICEYQIEHSASRIHPPGARRAFVVMLNPMDERKAKSKLGAIKAHLAAVAGCEQHEIDKSFLDRLERQPTMFEGKQVVLEVGEPIDLDTKGPVTPATKRPFTPQNWYSVGTGVQLAVPAETVVETVPEEDEGLAPF